ncbi:MAG: CPBP family intramembrane metalloprotease [Anaerolineae bacterium]|nr:CPBP family intramembrane metalloprotease [Anaerolineae bacterium]
MKTLKSFSMKQPILFGLILTVVWMALVLVFSGIAASIIRKPYGDVSTTIIGRLAVISCTVLLAWRLGWLEESGIARLGSWRAWLFTLGGLVYYAIVSLYAFYGRASFDFSILTRLPESRFIVLAQFVIAMSEEFLFRGLVLFVLVRVWGNTARGMIGSVVFTALLFAVLHVIQVFTNGLPTSAALYLVLATLVIAIWWGALVLLGRSIWPAVVLHFMGNAVVIVQGFATPMIEPEFLAYKSLLWFSMVLGVIGIGLLVNVASEKPAKQTLEI